MISMPADRIIATQARGARLLRKYGLEAEPVQTALAVEEHRWAWRPPSPSVILIAESHVFTSAADIALTVNYDSLPPELRHLPPTFVRLIHCLGYGEKSLLSGKPERANAGTRQYWDIFGRLAGTGPQPRAADTAVRLAWKVWTLQTLRDQGTWLLDASLHGIYAPKGDRVPHGLVLQLHGIWWQGYGSWLLGQCSSASVFAIGKGTGQSLTKLGVRLDGWVYQPQAARHRPGTSPPDMEYGWQPLLAAVARDATIG